MKKDYVCYNLILPVWVLWLFPQLFVWTIPLNLLIDFLVLFLTLRLAKIEPPPLFIRRSLWKVFLLGYLADLIGVVLLFSVYQIADRLGVPTYMGVNVFKNWVDFLITFGILVAVGYLIYLFNYHFVFKKMIPEQAKRIALMLAIFTTPYLFLIPVFYFY